MNRFVGLVCLSFAALGQGMGGGRVAAADRVPDSPGVQSQGLCAPFFPAYPGMEWSAGPGFTPGPSPRDAWWAGQRLPYSYQPTLIYPGWDYPVRSLHGWLPPGVPARDVPQGAAPAYWLRMGR